MNEVDKRMFFNITKKSQPKEGSIEQPIQEGEEFLIRNFWMEHLRALKGKLEPCIFEAVVRCVEDIMVDDEPHQKFTLRVNNGRRQYTVGTYRRRGVGIYTNRDERYWFGRSLYLSELGGNSFHKPLTLQEQPNLNEILAGIRMPGSKR